MEGTSRWVVVGQLVPLLVVSVIVIGNLLVYLEFLYNHDFVTSLLNTWSNFPTGLVTAIFTPDSQVFLCYTGNFSGSECFQGFMSWYAIDVGYLAFYLGLFYVINMNREARDRVLRLSFYGLMIVAVSVVSNLVDLSRPGVTGSVGPSTAAYTGIGLVYGFSIITVIGAPFGDRDIRNARNFFAIAISAIMVVVLTGFYLVDPTDFFNVNSLLKIDSAAHMFCFVGGTLVSLPFLIQDLRREQTPNPFA